MKILNKKLHIVCFDVPYPPDYGGVTDVYYKIKALSESGVDIYLHVFEYGRGRQDHLKKYCEKVFYYPRKKSFGKFLSLTPFIVNSRNDEGLIKNLNAIEAPVLFEGLHSTYPLLSKKLKQRTFLVRMHNIEHDYYKGVAKNEASWVKKTFYTIESSKLKRYEKVLNKCDHILSISPADQNHFEKIFGPKSVYIPAFHGHFKMQHRNKKGYFALYHGNLSVADNNKAAHYLIDVFKNLSVQLIIAGRSEDKKLLAKIEGAKNIQFIFIDDQKQLWDLIQRAHINILVSFQATGIKIKLLNALFNGRFCLVNPAMVKGSGLEDLCEIAKDKKEMIARLIPLMDNEFSKEQFALRKEKLSLFDNHKSAARILEII